MNANRKVTGAVLSAVLCPLVVAMMAVSPAHAALTAPESQTSEAQVFTATLGQPLSEAAESAQLSATSTQSTDDCTVYDNKVQFVALGNDAGVTRGIGSPFDVSI